MSKQELSTQTHEEKNFLEAAEKITHAKAQWEKWKKKTKDLESDLEDAYGDLQAARSGQKNLSKFSPAADDPEAEDPDVEE